MQSWGEDGVAIESNGAQHGIGDVADELVRIVCLEANRGIYGRLDRSRTRDFKEDDILAMFLPQRLKLVVAAGELNNKTRSLKDSLNGVRNAKVIAGQENRRAILLLRFTV